MEELSTEQLIKSGAAYINLRVLPLACRLYCSIDLEPQGQRRVQSAYAHIKHPSINTGEQSNTVRTSCPNAGPEE